MLVCCWEKEKEERRKRKGKEREKVIGAEDLM